MQDQVRKIDPRILVNNILSSLAVAQADVAELQSLTLGTIRMRDELAQENAQLKKELEELKATK